jgi:elongation factor 1 alpha-like protein
MDEDETERERGVTIDIATKQISTHHHDITILDAPGHADYIPAMISGAASADVGILVIAATTGEFEAGFGISSSSSSSSSGGGGCGQTKEHIIISRGLGVSQLIVAVNKLDSSDPPWSQSRFQEIQSRIEPFLVSNGFDLKRVTFVPISGLTGVNITKSLSSSSSVSLLSSWYNGKTLLEAIDSFEPCKRNFEKPLRFIISDVSLEGKYVAVKGRVVQGTVSAGNKVVVLPIGDEAVVYRIDNSFNSSTDGGSNDNNNNVLTNAERSKIAIAGDSVDLYLQGIDIARISPGNILSDVAVSLRPKLSQKIQAKILVMEQLAIPIIRGAQVVFHMHSLDIPAQISKIISSFGKSCLAHSDYGGSSSSAGPRINPRLLTSGSNGIVEIKLDYKVCIEEFNECRAMGRFVLRRGGNTIAVGIVESVHVKRHE